MSNSQQQKQPVKSNQGSPTSTATAPTLTEKAGRILSAAAEALQHAQDKADKT